MEIVFPKLTGYQQEVYDWLGDPYRSQKVAIIRSQRQVGKTFFLQVELIQMAVTHAGTVSAIFEPTIALGRKVWKSVVKALEPTGLIKSSNAQLLEVELTNGSTILFRSCESTNRGISLDLCILDEAAWLSEESIFEILPMVSARQAALILASTPFTMDGYYFTMFQKGMEGDPRIKTFDWSSNPETKRFLTDEQKELFKQTMSRSSYLTDICGQFLTSQGLLFQHLDECVKEAPEDTDVIYMGIDFGTGSEEDYTVLSVFNANGEMTNIHRTNHLTPMQQMEWLAELINGYAKDHSIRTVLGEINSIGKVYADVIKSLIKPVAITDWVTTNKSKQELVTTFQLALENEMVGLLREPNLLNELRHYTAEINVKTKTVTYNGYKCHDDCVMASMLGYYAFKKGLGNARIVLM